MANSSVDLSFAPRDKGATTRRLLPEYAGPNPYVVGGDATLLTLLGLGKIFTVLGNISNGTDIYLPYWNRTTQKLMWFLGSSGAEAGAVDLSGFTGTIEVIGQ